MVGHLLIVVRQILASDYSLRESFRRGAFAGLACMQTCAIICKFSASALSDCAKVIALKFYLKPYL